jgi:hypothetical protein
MIRIMAGKPATNCHVCASSQTGAVLLLGSETRRDDGPWVFVRQDKSYALCRACHQTVAAVAQSASLGTDASILGLPSGHQVSKHPGYCDYCDGRLDDKSFGLDILGNERETSGRTSKHAGAVVRQRLCISCGRWWISTLVGASYRSLEGPMGGWLADGETDAVAAFLSSRDRATLRTTLEAMGAAVLTLNALSERTDVPIFVRAGRPDRARTLVASLGRLARQTIVVSTVDSTEDARQALLAGAVDLLPEPLTPNQVAGALDRIRSRWSQSRSAATGLLVLGDDVPTSKYGLTATDFDFVSEEKTLLVNYLGLRRIVRGFDYVGVRDGRLAARIYASPDDVNGVRERLSDVLGLEATVRGVATEEPAKAA